MKLPLLIKKRITILVHIASWLLLFFLPFLLHPGQDRVARRNTAVEEAYFRQYLCNFLCWIALYYFNANFLIPRLIYNRRYLTYFLSLIPVFLVLFLVNWLSSFLLHPSPYNLPGFIAFFFLPCIFFLSSSTAITMFRSRLQSDQLSQQRETENLKTELAFLRSQVSPHFMFNVLNNMVMLARKGSESLEPSLFKLSTLMRYMLYETDEKKVLLDREVEYLQSYIDLQLQRFSRKVAVHVHVEPFDESYMIEPMLLIPFVENAFKHGTGFRQKGDISISLRAQHGVLEFKVDNYYDPSLQQVKDNTSGIGLQNVKRRLDLLYGPRHTLRIRDADSRFCVVLTLNLHHAEMYSHR
ncbi:MAG: histidine kinase [Williamsia sp.]|nr:histidine kinase [Williamsia sp.]